MATNLNNAMSPRQKGIGSIVEYKGEQYKIVGDKGDDGWELEKTDPKISHWSCKKYDLPISSKKK